MKNFFRTLDWLKKVKKKQFLAILVQKVCKSEIAHRTPKKVLRTHIARCFQNVFGTHDRTSHTPWQVILCLNLDFANVNSPIPGFCTKIFPDLYGFT